MRTAGGERGLEEPPGGGEALHVRLCFSLCACVGSQEAVAARELVDWWRWPTARL
jgi:hypothetical protein